MDICSWGEEASVLRAPGFNNLAADLLWTQTLRSRAGAQTTELQLRLEFQYPTQPWQWLTFGNQQMGALSISLCLCLSNLREILKTDSVTYPLHGSWATWVLRTESAKLQFPMWWIGQESLKVLCDCYFRTLTNGCIASSKVKAKHITTTEMNLQKRSTDLSVVTVMINQLSIRGLFFRRSHTARRWEY